MTDPEPTAPTRGEHSPPGAQPDSTRDDNAAARHEGQPTGDRLARHRELIAEPEFVHAAAHQIARDAGEVIVALAAAKGLGPFVQAYASALGKALGEATAAALKRIDTLWYLEDVLSAPDAAAIELRPDLPHRGPGRGRALRHRPGRARPGQQDAALG